MQKLTFLRPAILVASLLAISCVLVFGSFGTAFATTVQYVNDLKAAAGASSGWSNLVSQTIVAKTPVSAADKAKGIVEKGLNINSVVSSSNSPFGSGGGTAFYKNGDGTYSTITYESTDTGGNKNKNNPPRPCHTTYSGKGGPSSTVCNCPPGQVQEGNRCVPTVSCPAGQVLENGHCVTPPPTCPRGQQTQNGHCVNTPTCQGGQVAQNGRCVTITHRSCTLDGRTIVDGGHWTFFSHRTVASGQLCSSFDQVRTCTDGSLSGSASFRYQSCSVDQAQNTATAPIISITATPSIVRLGGSSKIVWDGGLATSCSVSGPGLSSTSIRGSKIISNIQEQSVYLLSCATGAAAAEDSATVDIVPIWREY